MKLSKSKQSNIDHHHLPIYDPNSSIGKKEMTSSSSSRSKSKEMLVHLIPLIVFICLFVLWCLSYPGIIIIISILFINFISMCLKIPISMFRSGIGSVLVQILIYLCSNYLSLSLSLYIYIYLYVCIISILH